jgi:putative SOS response-associated peptidase YedK
MCGRYSNRYTWRELVELYRLSHGFDESDWEPKFNIAPTTQIPVIRFIDGQRRIDLMRWGLVPSWSKEIGKFATFNARADTCTDKPTYRGAWKAGRRCIIPASSFFEWRKSDKQPFAIGLGNHGPMAFAGLWDEWKAKDDPPILSATMITTEGNSVMQPIHDRMPVVIGEENLGAWLGEEVATPEQLRAMLTPFPAERLTAWTVSKAVGSVKNQSPELTEPVTSGLDL